MKYFELDNKEKKILQDFDQGKLVRVKDFDKQKRSLKAAARTTLSKTRNINIRLAQKDLQKLKAKAIREGIPYQTLAASILHRVADK